ncbi:MAG TPA: ClpX C4-type zinc finger protein, partial [Polyangiaceae bacterium]
MNCNFCDKPRAEVHLLIAGNGATICEECVDLAAEIVAEERREALRWLSAFGNLELAVKQEQEQL